MAQINLVIIDTPPIDYSDFQIEMKRWLSNSTDVLNEDLTLLGNAFNFLLAVSSIDVGGGGAGPIAVPVLGLTPAGSVDATLLSSTNPVSILSVVSGTDQFFITFSGDPGAVAVIKYIAFTQAP